MDPETHLQRCFLISNSFYGIWMKSLNQGKRKLNMVMIVYLLAETVKTFAWLLLPLTHPLSILTGSYFYVLGSAGKLLYACIASVSANALFGRVALYYLEPRDLLDFITEPITYFESLPQKRQLTKHQMLFRKQVNFLWKKSKFEILNAILVSNTFTMITCYQCAIKSGHYLSSVIGWFSHLFQSTLYQNGNAITTFCWQTSLLYVDLKMTRILNTIQSTKMTTKSVDRIIGDIRNLRNRINNYNRSLRLFLLASIASTTPITVTLIHTLIFETQGIVKTFLLPMFIVLTVQGWYPCYLSTKIWSKSQVIYSRLNSIQVRYHNLTLDQRWSLFSEIESLGSATKPLSVLKMDGEPYTPAQFYQYLETCILTLILLIDNL